MSLCPKEWVYVGVVDCHSHAEFFDHFGFTYFLDSFGEYEDEVIEYKETNDVPDCSKCRYGLDHSWFAPCCECQGYWSTGKSYFERTI